MITKWICKKCFEEITKREGKEREIKSLPNVAGVTCKICNKGKADYLLTGFIEEKEIIV